MINHTRFVLTVETPSEGDKAFQAVEEIRDIAHQYYGDDYKLAGDTVSTYDMRDVTTADMNKVNTVAIVAVFLVITTNNKISFYTTCFGISYRRCYLGEFSSSCLHE